MRNIVILVFVAGILISNDRVSSQMAENNSIQRICGYCGMPFLNEHKLDKSSSTVVKDTILVSAEFVPSVIFNDGESSSRLEVTIIESTVDIDSVRLVIRPDLSFSVDGHTFDLNLPRDQQPRIPLFDDGTHGDRVAGDGIFTIHNITYLRSGNLEFRGIPKITMPPLGNIFINDIVSHEIGGSFFNLPELGVLDPSLAIETDIRLITDEIQIASNLVNVKTSVGFYERIFRGLKPFSDIATLTNKFYAVLPDDFHFLMLFPTYLFELIDPTASLITVGSFVHAQSNVQGIGLSSFDNTSSFGSQGTLLGFPLVGIQDLFSPLIEHEIVHYWAAFLPTELGLSGGAHWRFNTSIGGVVGGSRWQNNNDGTFSALDICGDFRPFAELELYLMGLLPSDSVSNIYIADNTNQDFFTPGSTITGPFQTVSIDDIIAAAGPRIPSTDESLKDFRCAFVALSHDRLLTAEELTFFNIISKVFSGQIPVDADYFCLDNFPFAQRADFLATMSTELFTPTTSVEQIGSETPNDFRLGQNYPNPFNPATTIEFDLPKIAKVKLEIFNLLGQKVKTLIEEKKDAGFHSVPWDSRNDFGIPLASGVYIYRVTTKDFVAARKMVLLR